jgi:hypothetical protein
VVLEAEVWLQGNHGNFCIQSDTRADLCVNVLVFIIPVKLYAHKYPAFLRLSWGQIEVHCQSPLWPSSLTQHI